MSEASPDSLNEGASDRTLPRHGPQVPTIAGIELQVEIGRGGMGVVYRGQQEFLQRQVAVKLITTQAIDVTSARFQREARILSSIAHPNIVGCYQAGVLSSGEGYIVMEFVDGPTLRQVINRDGALPVDVALRIGGDVARALQCAHESGVIHRDVKPENIMLQHVREGMVSDGFPYVPKLVDFGIARAEQTAEDITRPGEVIGTCATMAPEQFESALSVDHRADIYALGCVLFHALTGRVAFPEKTVTGVMASKQFGKVPNPADVVAGLPGGVVSLVRSMLAKRPQDRPGDYAVLIAKIEDLIVAERSGAAGNRRPFGRLGLGLGAVAVLGAGAWFALRGFGSPPAPVAPVAVPELVAAAAAPVKKDEPIPAPPPNIAPEVAISAPTTALAGSTLELKSVVVDPDSANLTYAWRIDEGFAPQTLDLTGPILRLPLTHAVPGTEFTASLGVSDGVHDPVTRQVRVLVEPSPRSVELFPDDEMADLDGWDGIGTPPRFMVYAPYVITGDGREHRCSMSKPLPEGSFWFTGAIEAVADFNQEAPTGKVGLRLLGADGEVAALWYQAGGTAAQCVASVQPAGSTGSAASTSPVTTNLSGLTCGKLYVSIRVEQSIQVVFGARSHWQSVELPRSAGLSLEVFGVGGLTRFYDFRLETL